VTAEEVVALAELLGSAKLPADAERVGRYRGPRAKAVLESRRAAKQFRSTSRVQILSRNLGFRLTSAVINSRFTRRTTSRAETPAAP